MESVQNCVLFLHFILFFFILPAFWLDDFFMTFSFFTAFLSNHFFQFLSELLALQFFRFFGNFLQPFSDFSHTSVESHSHLVPTFTSFLSSQVSTDFSYATDCISSNLFFLCIFFFFPNHHIISNTKTNQFGEPNMSHTRLFINKHTCFYSSTYFFQEY